MENIAQGDELTAVELNLVGGGYGCGYLGVYDYGQMMSYETRNYSCGGGSWRGFLTLQCLP